MFVSYISAALVGDSHLWARTSSQDQQRQPFSARIRSVTDRVKTKRCPGGGATNKAVSRGDSPQTDRSSFVGLSRVGFTRRLEHPHVRDSRFLVVVADASEAKAAVPLLEVGLC